MNNHDALNLRYAYPLFDCLPFRQKEYMEKLAKQKHGASGGSELDFLTERKKGVSSTSIQVGFTQQQLQVVDDLEAVAEERDEREERRLVLLRQPAAPGEGEGGIGL